MCDVYTNIFVLITMTLRWLLYNIYPFSFHHFADSSFVLEKLNWLSILIYTIGLTQQQQDIYKPFDDVKK